MILTIMMIWAMDVFVLVNYRLYAAKKIFNVLLIVLFALVVLSLLMLVVRPAFAQDFSGVFFIALSCYLLVRKKIGDLFYQRSYYENQGTVKGFLFFTLLGLSLIWFWGTMFLSAGAQAVSMMWPSFEAGLGTSSVLSLLVSALMVVLIVRFQRRAPLYSLRELLGLRKTTYSEWIDWVLPISLGMLMAMVASLVLTFRYEQPVTPLSEMMDWATMSWTLGFFLFAAVVTAPFLEEIIFRGFFFKMIKESVNKQWAFWIVAVTFGVLHIEQYWGDWTGVLFIGVVGLILTALRYKLGSVRQAMVMHYVFNGLMVLIPAVIFIAMHPLYWEYHIAKENASVAEQEQLLHKSIAEDPRNVTAYDELARLYLDHDGDLNKALKAIDRALAVSPQRTIFQYTRAEILLEMGRIADAASILEAILEQMPGNVAVRRRLEEITQ